MSSATDPPLSSIPSPNSSIPSQISYDVPSRDSIVLLHLPISTKLTRTNFLACKSQIEPLLHGHRLHKYFTSDPPPEKIEIEEQLRPNPIFSASSRSCLLELRRSLQTTIKGGSGCREYFSKIRATADELAFIGSPVTDDDMILYILGGLGADFNLFVTTITARQGPTSLLELQSLLLTHETMIIKLVLSSLLLPLLLPPMRTSLSPDQVQDLTTLNPVTDLPTPDLVITLDPVPDHLIIRDPLIPLRCY